MDGTRAHYDSGNTWDTKSSACPHIGEGEK